MIVLVVLLGAVALAAIVVAVVSRRRVAAARSRATTAEETATLRGAEAAEAHAARERAEHLRIEADEQRTVVEESSRAAVDAASTRADVAQDAAAAAEARARASERAAADASPGVDADLAWAMEVARSERTWRLLLALGPDVPSVFADSADPLRTALEVEAGAAREEVGAVVEVESDVPPGALTSTASVLVLRAVQELLATVVRRSERTTVRLTLDGEDVCVDVRSVDEHGDHVHPVVMSVPPSIQVEAIEDGVRIRHALA